MSLKTDYQIGLVEGPNKETKDQMTASLKVGITFNDKKLKTTYKDQVENSTNYDMEKSWNTDSISCQTAATGTPAGVGIYQYQVDNNGGYVSTYHAICRYGDNAATAPACPWNACMDSQCTTC